MQSTILSLLTNMFCLILCLANVTCTTEDPCSCCSITQTHKPKHLTRNKNSKQNKMVVCGTREYESLCKLLPVKQEQNNNNNNNRKPTHQTFSIFVHRQYLKIKPLLPTFKYILDKVLSTAHAFMCCKTLICTKYSQTVLPHYQ